MKRLYHVLTLGVMFLLSSCGGGAAVPWSDKESKSMAYIMTEDFVKQKLKSPGSAKFPSVWDGKVDHVSYLGGQKYRINSYVDSQNSFGALMRTHFTAEIQQISEDRWRLISLEFKE